ncbi:ABC-type multidrug transport system, ATPase component [Arcticibacter svalbardensis MN12-7]|uniref:ABC-type multidrug transport system, ATPase component n=1 Tax=Arcticibacter svalbardensis MN12-7 TaxID=1150600 RepID=R9GWI6_9SPHI|nr:ATP-binding cassette domain-containing protein [Arcticibacter svalbardensis]EOR96033.1 ABC-type multidrug transport system, ATPase component [Arcticibacter svalbardensis MN12-7]
MSIVVTNLTKVYEQQKAIDNISFTAHQGEILGFLGPNGAGKSTTMKILSCFIPQTSGTAEVAGFDVVKNPMEVRRQLGYLPEHNPLYLEMYVKESLGFIADLHKLQNKKQRIEEIIALTGLEQEQHKKLNALSKGFRQRVGIAQSLIHDPQVLILDEPTSGLDPAQLVGIRALIRELGKTKTIIFSTHIMQEAEQLCDRAVIINQGHLVCDETLPDLMKKYPQHTLEEIFLKLIQPIQK